MNRFKKIKKIIKIKIRRRIYDIQDYFFELKRKTSYLKLMHWTYPKKIFLGILIILIIGACLLYSPISFNYESYQYVNNQFVFNFNVSNPNEVIGIGKKTVHYDFIDALFMASSAFTNTGFSLLNIGSEITFFGQFVILFLVQIGGLGYMSVFYLIGRAIQNITKKKIFSTSMLNIERGGTKISSSYTMIVRIFIIILAIQLCFALIISGILYSYPFKQQQDWNTLLTTLPKDTTFSFVVNGKTYTFDTSNKNINNLLSLTFNNIEGKTLLSYQNYPLAFWHALFLTGASINSAGFDLFGSTSLQLFRNDAGLSIQTLTLILIFIGGIGFPIIYDFSLSIEWFFKYKILYKVFHKQRYMHLQKPKWNIFSKVCIYSWIFVTLISLVILYSIEYFNKSQANSLDSEDIQNYFSLINYPNSVIVNLPNNPIKINFFGENPILNKNFSIFYTSISTRSAGYATVNMITFTEPSIMFLSILMFIGTSPSSTGGGIRTTTIAVVFKSLFSWLRGVEKTSLFKRRIPTKTVTNAFLILIISIMLMIVMTLLLYLTSELNIAGKNLVSEEFKNKSILYSFTYFLFECASAFGTSGLTVGIVNSAYFQWWNLLILIILMFIGQLGVSSTLLIFARKTPKKTEASYLEHDIRLG